MSQISLFKVFMSDDVIEPVTKTLQSGFVTQGPRVEEFEQGLRDFFQAPHLLTVNSATSALTLAYRLLKKPDPERNWPGVQEGDEVLSCPQTCFATTVPIMANGMKIKWVDVDSQTSNINLNDLRAKLSPKTKIITFVHWGGMPLDLAELEKIRDEAEAKYGFRPQVVEDAAHAFGAEFNGKKIGSHGYYSCFSFQAIKHLTTCDGGLLIVPHEDAYHRGKLLRWYGIDRDKRNYNYKDFRLENDIVDWGYKFHMNDLNATIGLANLKHMPDIIQKNQENDAYYREHLQNIPGLRVVEFPEGAKTAAWLFTLAVERKYDFINTMKERGIMTSQVHQRNDVHSCVADFVTDLPLLDEYEKELVCIPVGWWVTPEQREHIVASIKQGW